MLWLRMLTSLLTWDPIPEGVLECIVGSALCGNWRISAMVYWALQRRNFTLMSWTCIKGFWHRSSSTWDVIFYPCLKYLALLSVFSAATIHSNRDLHTLCDKMGLFPDMLNCGLCMSWECRERSPHHRLQKELLVSDPGMHHGTCVTHVPWCMSGLFTHGGRENVPGIPSACATRNFTYLARGPRWFFHFNL